MKKIVWIGLAGAAGALLRTWIGQFITSETGFPLATFFVNVVGTFMLCFLIVGGLRKLSVHQDLQDAVTTGFLGSFTTFSALSMETVLLIENGQLVMAILYVSASMIGGLVAGLLGFYFGRKRVSA